MQYGDLITTLLNITCYLTQQESSECSNIISGVNVTDLSDFCVTNRDCPTDQVCADFRCVNPCLEQCQECQTNEDCPIVNLLPNKQCSSPGLGSCGSNTICHVTNHVPSCVCKSEHVGDPKTGCTAVECSNHDQCPENKACTHGVCKDPCPGLCGDNAICQVSNHNPTCVCVQGFSGDGFHGCRKIQKVFHFQTDKKLNWYEALADCTNRGLRLATLDNEAEFQQLREMIKQTLTRKNEPHTSVWLSGSDLGKYGTFVWMSTGRPLTFTKWETKNPDHWVLNGEVQHCIQLWASQNYHMDDVQCSTPLYYTCESITNV